MQGWLAWDSYHICTCATGVVPAPLPQSRLWSITKRVRLCTPQWPCIWVPIAILLMVSSPTSDTVSCTFARAYLRLHVMFSSGHQRRAQVRGKLLAHWKETLQKKQRDHGVFCISTPGVKRRLYTFPCSLWGIYTKVIEFCSAFTIASLHPLSRSSPPTEDIEAYSWNQSAQKLKTKYNILKRKWGRRGPPLQTFPAQLAPERSIMYFTWHGTNLEGIMRLISKVLVQEREWKW